MFTGVPTILAAGLAAERPAMTPTATTEGRSSRAAFKSRWEHCG
jgi:hypothetical protein